MNGCLRSKVATREAVSVKRRLESIERTSAEITPDTAPGYNSQEAVSSTGLTNEDCHGDRINDGAR